MNDETNSPVELKFVDPKNDVAFRKIFGDENKKDILISFLNNILDFAGTNKEIMDITITNPYQVPKLKELKETILDEKTNENHFHDFELNFVELPKFTKTLEELKDIKDKWIYFVKNAGDMKMIPKELEEPKELREAFETANQMCWSKEELDAYDGRIGDR